MSLYPGSIGEARSWLRGVAIPELPTRLHARDTGDDGAPRFSGDFWNWLIRDDAPDLDPEGNPIYRTTWAFQVEKRTIWEPCPRPHPIRQKGEARCEMCDDALGWQKTRPLYVRPFQAALERIRSHKATSPQWPTPHALVIAFLRADGDTIRAGASIGRPPHSADELATLEAAFINAIRKVHAEWRSGPEYARLRKSESQSIADAAA